jgi:3-oxoacyl-[acyl-carrier protein] reductase
MVSLPSETGKISEITGKGDQVTMKLENRRAIVTGAAQGLGFAIASRLNAEGCKVAMLDINEEKVCAAAAELKDCFGVKCNVSSADDIAAAVKTCAEKLGGIDIVVNNAGILHNSSIPEATEKEWDMVLAINLKGPFFVVQQALPYLKESSCARVINIGSLAGRMGGFETGLAYSASKGGINALTMGLARQLSPFKINVNAVCPGTTETPITQAFTPEAMERLLTRIPLGRLGQPADMAAAVAFLASDDAAFITGLLMDVNGGMYMG